ncbi:rhomboid family intramembrane serine protease [Flavobacteriaceae bacterium TP-CH-4]|uniref:Rhomboid family intramembrane serine protease n=1 Tax=Pelagihabitans pacificus TaxID=2696054 RepID=A0A967AXX8_9FLAO|nr:rhomboid family intramembrane serine protease [Pelagihabitans pacificus]NHF61150.1 rhomboid family intramembrane serine protease [Pelagihabitans pacificus]
MGRLTEGVKHLLIVNVLFFVATSLYGEVMYQWFALWFPKNENFAIWQVLTHMFMHGGFAHIGFNMFALWMFGTPVERSLGMKKFLFIYFSAGLGAVLFQLGYYYFEYFPTYSNLIGSGLNGDQIVRMLTTNQASDALSTAQIDNLRAIFPIYNASMVGASGCIMGILAAFGTMNPNAQLMMIFLPIPIKAKYFIPGIILLDVISALTGQSFFSPSNTAYMAHVGGAIFGFLIMWYWKKNQFNDKRWN